MTATADANGRSGSSGRGGIITVICGPPAKPYLGAIRVFHPGSPRPVFREEPMGALG